MVASQLYHVALGSRLLGSVALRRGMPLYQYFSNRLWTSGQNLGVGQHLSEYHTGARAYSREFLLRVPLLDNSDDFLFDNHSILQAMYYGYAIGELSVPARWTADGSTMHPWRGIVYGLGIVRATGEYWLQRSGLAHLPRCESSGRRLAAQQQAPAACKGHRGSS